jgi:hypothetical protein
MKACGMVGPRRLPVCAMAVACMAATTVHAWYGDRAALPGRPLPGQAGAPAPGFGPGATKPLTISPAYGPIAPPHPSKAAVIELLEDDAGRLARSLNPGEDLTNLGRAGAWGEDCFSGVCSLKVAGYQRYRQSHPGWNYPVVEKPQPGEYRYLRFAWKKPEGRGVMVQLAVSGIDWGRYFAGENAVNFYPALQVNPRPPREWEVVTRDLFEDFGRVPFNLTGFAFTSMDGVALFDHVYLGRTIEDLDKVTGAARTWARRVESLGTVNLEEHWKNLASEDAVVRQPSVWALGACAKSSVPFVIEQVKVPDGKVMERRIKQAIADLDAPRYPVRERASKDLETIGLTALLDLEAAVAKEGVSPESRTRLEKLIAKAKTEESLLTEPQAATLRAMRVLEQAETGDAKALLEKLSEAGLEAGLSLEAKAAAERVGKRRR